VIEAFSLMEATTSGDPPFNKKLKSEVPKTCPTSRSKSGLSARKSRASEVFGLLIGLCLACCLAACEEQQTPNAFRLATLQLHIKSNVLNTEVADTPLTLERGLMFRDSMPDDHGMLFIFDHPKTAAFWNRNTKIPLSIAYIDAAGKIVEIKSLRPFDETPVPSTSDQIAFALEVNEGWFSRHGIITGTRIQGLPPVGSTHQ
jgi:uncharacterized membrane protein (UPF0127 family)